MADAESGTAPDEPYSLSAGWLPPEGWVLDRHGLAHVDPGSPLLDDDRLNAAEGRLRDQLRSHATLVATVEQLTADYATAEAEIAEGDTDAHNALLDALVADARNLAKTHTVPGVVAMNVFRFVMETVFENPRAIAAGAGRLQPATLVANPTTETKSIALHPGDIAAIFRGASENERNAYTGLIEEMQKALGHPRKGAGRKRRQHHFVAKPRKTDPTVAAHLARQGRSTEDIACILAAVYPGDGWDHTDYERGGLAQRVRRCVEDGESLLAPPWTNSEEK